jgi:hypothetical protein
MFCCPIAIVVLASFLMLATEPAVSQEKKLTTDANIVTALDVSDSVMRHDEWLQLQGLAKAITHPAFLKAVTSGRHGRIGFTVFAWSSDGAFAPVVPWKVVGSRADAVQIAAMLESFPRIDRSDWADTGNGSDAIADGPERRTDVSSAVDFATMLARRRPFVGHTVINVTANGIDNVGTGPGAARDRAVAAGLVVNGLIISGKEGVADDFRANVQGGPGSFVVEVLEPADVVEAMLEKLLRDLISAAASQAWT